MAASFDKAATVLAGSGSTAAITWAVNPTAGAKVLVAFSFPGAVTVTSVADNGTTPRTFTAEKGPGTGSNKLYVYRGDAITLPSAGSYTVTVTLSGASGGIAAGGASYLGVAAGGPTASNATTGTSTAVSTGTATPAAAGALFFGAFNDVSGLNPETITLTGSGFTGRGTQTNGASNVCTGFADKIDAGGPTATACTWTLGDSVGWSGAIVTYDAAPTGTPIPSNLLGYNAESMETSAAAWSALANCTVAQTLVRGMDGAASLRLTTTAIGNCTAICNTANQAYPLVTVGRVYQWSYWVFLSAALSVTPIFDWYNGTTFVSSASGGARAVPANVWTFVGFISAPAPATTTLARVYPAFTSTAASGQTADIDEIYFGPAGPGPNQLRPRLNRPARGPAQRDAVFAR